MREPDLTDPAVVRRGDERHRRARRPIRGDALTWRRARGGGALHLHFASGLDGVLDLGVLDLELEGAGQGVARSNATHAVSSSRTRRITFSVYLGLLADHVQERLALLVADDLERARQRVG